MSQTTLRPTMREVAQRAGVSQVTVTNVLRGRTARTSEETRERVLRTVKELGYTPVLQPASQRFHIETKVIGINFDTVVLGQDYLAMHAYLGLSEAATRHGYDLLMMHRPLPDWAPDREEVKFLDRRSDGFIFIAPVGRRNVLETLAEHKIPTMICCGNDAPAGVGWVVNDEANNMRTALRFLCERGHQRIAYYEKREHDVGSPKRAEYFEHIAKELGLSKSTRRFGDDGSANPWRVVETDLDDIQAWGATAVLCFNDHLAFRFCDIAQARGVQIPRDLSVMGIDDFPEAASYGLTTIRNDFRAQASLAVDNWLALANGSDYRELRQSVPGALIERSSVAKR